MSPSVEIKDYVVSEKSETCRTQMSAFNKGCTEPKPLTPQIRVSRLLQSIKYV